MINDLPKNYLVFSMSRYYEWSSGVENRNYHLIKNLLKRSDTGKIIMVEYLPLNFRQTIKNFIYSLKNEKNGKILKRCSLFQFIKIEENFYVLTVYKLPTKLLWDELNDLIKKYFNDDYYLWSFLPTYIDYYQTLTQPKAKIFDAVDDWSKHASYKNYSQRLDSNYQYINNNVDYIFVVSPHLEKKFSRTEKVYFIPNGVDFNHFQQREKIINRDIANLEHPIIGYVGTIQDRFNVEIIKAITNKMPKASIALIGPIWYKKLRTELLKIKNVFLLGQKPYSQTPTYIQQFDVGIIPNHFDDFEKTTDPMKIYNYLACGKPVVCSYLPANEKLHPFIKIGDNPQSFADAVAQAYAEDDKDKYLERIEFAKEQSWYSRLQQILEIILSDRHNNQTL